MTSRPKPASSWIRRLAPVALATGAAFCAMGMLPAAADSLGSAFITETNAAMDRMMAAMAVKPSGDIDRDFAAMMIPHHQGAIEMAQAELRYGTNEQLRRIAQEIIVEQQQEIAAMHLALDQPLPPSAAAPTQGQPAPSNTNATVPHAMSGPHMHH